MFARIILGGCAAAIALPALAQEVNVYSYRQPELIAPLTEAFTDQTGIDVNVVFLKKGLVERLKAEGDLSPADLIFTVDVSRLTSAVEAGVVQPVDSQTLEDNIPAAFRHPEGLWFGLTARARIVYASKERVDPGAVTTYEALADDEWEGRICTRSGNHVYTIGLLSAVVAHHGEAAAEDWLAGVKNNLARRPQGGDRSQVKAIWAGECDISLGNNYYIVKMLDDPDQKAWAESVNVVFPTFEDGGVHMNISGMAMTESAPNRDAALKMMEFLSSPEAQRIYAEVNGEYPVNPEVEPSELVQSFGDFEADDIALSKIGALRPDALKIVDRVAFDE